MRATLSALVVALGAALPAQALEVRGQGRVWGGPGFDSNAARNYTSLSITTQPDLFAYLLGTLEGSLLGETRQATGAYDVSGRKYVFLGSQDTIIQSLELDGSQQLSRSVAVGLAGRARDRRGADRDYTDLLASAVLDFAPDAKVHLQARAGPHRFLYYPTFAYSFWGLDVSVNAQYRFDRRHSLSLFGDVNPRTFNASARPIPPDPNDPDPLPPPDPPPVRKDFFITAGLLYQYRGGWQFSASYSFTGSTSNSYGETYGRHRLSLTAGVRLPARFMLLASGTLQLTDFPQGMPIDEVQIAEDEETASSVTLKILRPLSKNVDLDLRTALYVNVMPRNHFFYTRLVTTLGVSVSF